MLWPRLSNKQINSNWQNACCGRILPASLGLVLSMQALSGLAQEEAGAAQKASESIVQTADFPTASDAPPPAPPDNVLRNAELLNRMDEDRLPTRPRRFLKLRFKQVRRAKDEKILQLLLICVGFVGVFVAILALRSVPPSRPSS